MNDEALKQNAINLVKQHRKNCEDAECGVSLHMVLELLIKAEISLTREEKSVFY